MIIQCSRADIDFSQTNTNQIQTNQPLNNNKTTVLENSVQVNTVYQTREAATHNPTKERCCFTVDGMTVLHNVLHSITVSSQTD